MLFCLVAETVALLFAAGVLDEVGLCATASMDTKPVIRKILIIIINFFIALNFLGLKLLVRPHSPSFV